MPADGDDCSSSLRLPLPYDVISPHVTSLKECAEYQIRLLLAKEQNGTLNNNDTGGQNEEDCLDNGFCLCDLNVVANKLRAWYRLFPRIQPFYALKCNPDVMVAAVLATAGTNNDGCKAGFDCASVSELHLARDSLRLARQTKKKQNDNDNNTSSSSSNSYKIVYANPQRAEKDLDTALSMFLQQQAAAGGSDEDDIRPPPLTFDGPEELYKVHRAYQKLLQESNNNVQPPSPPEMVLRLLVPDEHSSVPLGEKFGAELSSVPLLLKTADRLGLPVTGVSFHCGSGNHDPTAYATAIQISVQAMDMINDNNHKNNNNKRCRLLDIGGGYPGLDGIGGDYGRFCGANHVKENPQHVKQEDEEETTAKIAAVVVPLLDKLFPPDFHDDNDDEQVEIISEPGRYFVEGAFALCSRIYRLCVDKQGRRHYYIAHGVQGVFKDCVLCGETFVPIPLSLNETNNNDPDSSPSSSSTTTETTTVPSTVHGPSGEDYDVICHEYPLPILNIGDWLIFDRMGAYTLSIAARNGRPPIRYVMGGTKLY